MKNFKCHLYNDFKDISGLAKVGCIFQSVF
jgi:hypothetical protein